MVSIAEPRQLSTGIRWTPRQWDFLTWRAPPDALGRPVVEHARGLGEFGGGKTTGGSGRFVAVALENPFVDGVHKHDDPPMSGIVGPTMTSVHQGPLRELFKVLPREMVHTRRLYGIHQDLTLINGHVIKLYSASGAMEGPTLCQVWADEIQHPAFNGRYRNLQARVRDARARRLNVQVTGIAETGGQVERLFRKEDTECERLWMFRTADNVRNLAAGVLEGLLASRSFDEIATAADGWQTPRDLCWPMFDAAIHMARAPNLAELRANATHLGVDLRTHAAIVFGQTTEEIRGQRGLLILDQLIADQKSAEDLCKIIKDAKPGWKIGFGSTIALDPTLSIDEVNHFKRSFPGAKIVQHKSGELLDSKTGRRALARALLDGQRVARLFFHPRLSGAHARGVVESVRGLKEAKLKDNWFEHAADAARYIVQELVPIPEFAYAPALPGLSSEQNLRSGR